MPIDEIARRKFELQATAIANALTALNSGITSVSQSGVAIEAILIAYLEGLERVTGATVDTNRIRALVDSAYTRLNDPTVIAALEAVQQDFNDAAEEIGRLVGAIR